MIEEILEIVVDDRESEEIKNAIEFIINDPQFKHFKITSERLKTCDLILRTKTRIGTVGIEFKRGDDFVDSFLDGRYPNQVIQMKNQEHLDNLIFILVGDIKEVFSKRNINPSAYYGGVGALCTKYGCSVLNVPDDFSAVMQSFYIFKHSNLVPRITPKMNIKINTQERQIASISCIEGIGNGLAIKVLEEFTIGVLASIKDPKIIADRVDGIGIKKAQNIIDFFHNLGM